MGRSIEDLAIHPLFYDALSGEFQPASDPEHDHTLGRLAVATYLKGQCVSYFGLLDACFFKLQYSPSWSPDTKAIVECASIGRRYGNADVITGVELRSEEGDRLHIYKGMVDGESRLLVGNAVEDDAHHQLVLGETLAAAKLAVTGAATRFFNPQK